MTIDTTGVSKEGLANGSTNGTTSDRGRASGRVTQRGQDLPAPNEHYNARKSCSIMILRVCIRDGQSMAPLMDAFVSLNGRGMNAEVAGIFIDAE
jgi:hypothetical protein